LAARLRPVEGTRQTAGMAPNDDFGPMGARLAQESKNLMLVGHLPYLSHLVARLLGLPADKPLVRFQTGGVVRLDREESEQWVVRWMLTPELLPPS
jgi:phosphohistidine phosphatase SixA